MLVTLQEIIGMAEKGNYCIPAFNALWACLMRQRRQRLLL